MSDLIIAVCCATCGHEAAGEPPPVSWSAAITDGQRSWACAECTRAHIAGIESRLPYANW